MKKAIVLALVLLTASVISCNKNQKAVKKLEGDWEEVSINGVALADNEKGTTHFNYCELKKDEWCTAYNINSNGTNTGIYDYLVDEKGKVMVQRIQDSTKGSIQLEAKIKELNDSKLILEFNFVGFVTTTEYKKK